MPRCAAHLARLWSMLCSPRSSVLGCTAPSTRALRDMLGQRMAESAVPKLELNDGNKMPAIALGTYLGFDLNGVMKPKDKQLRDAVLTALDAGYRHVDTATVYGTEQEIGEALNMKFDSGALKREDVFVTTKLWNTRHKRDQVPVAIRESLRQLNLSYVDLYLMHWPIGLNEDYTFSDEDFMSTWRGMEEVKALGLAKSIGVSNFNENQLRRLIREATVMPAALEIEVHPQITQDKLVELARTHGIVVMGYSPFGSLVLRNGARQDGPSIDDPTLGAIAEKYNKTIPQVMLRWQIDRNIVPIPKSTNPDRIKQNINIFDFKLSSEDIDKINSFNENKRYTLPTFWQNHIYYPFEKVDNPYPDVFKDLYTKKLINI